MNNYVLWIVGLLLVVVAVYVIWTRRKKISKRNKNKKSDPVPTFLTSPDKCEHKNWSSRYDFETYPGAVAFKESRCLDCGIYERGSGQ